MKITRLSTESIEPGGHGFVVAAIIESEDLPDRSIPLIVRFGSVIASSVTALGSAPGVRALFSEMPPVGAILIVGYLDEHAETTDFKFVPPGDPRVA